MFEKRLNLLFNSLLKTICTYNQQEIDMDSALENAFNLIQSCVNQNGIIYVIGNGGSCSIASHFSVDLLKTLGIPCITISDPSVLTCLSNDLGYENVYSNSLKVLLKPQDLLLSISSSGQSANILKAVQSASAIGTKQITLSGFLEDNPLRSLGDLNFYIEQSDYGIVEIAHSFILHSLVDLWKSINNKKNTSLLDALSNAK